MCKSSLGQRSYNVEVDGQTYRRNRRQLKVTSETAPIGTVDDPTPDEGGPTGQQAYVVVDLPLPVSSPELVAGDPERYAETRQANQDA